MSHMDTAETSIPKQIKKLKDNLPDALVYAGGAHEAEEIVNEMRKQGVTIPMIGGEDLMDKQFLVLGDGVVGTIVYGGFNPDSKNPKVRHFVAAYKKRFGQTPSRLAALSYDAFNLLVEAIKRAESMRPSHLQQAMFIKEFHGVTGKMKITEAGEAIKEPFIFEAKKIKGKPKFVAVKDAQF
jgi:branched-chain amino acid transport system substrate-binding protein